MNDKTAQTVMDELRLAKRAITMAGLNGWGNLFSDAADTIDNLRAQLADAQRDAVVGTKVDMTNDFLHTLIEKADYYGGQFDIQSGNEKWIVTVTKEPS